MTVAYETNVLTKVFFELHWYVQDRSKDLQVRRWFYRQMNEIYDEICARAVRGGDKVANEFYESTYELADGLSDSERVELMS